MKTCEVKKDDIWVPIGIEEAYELPPNEVKRCIGCWGQVHLYPAIKDSEASVPHFGHNKAHANCPNEKHPDAIE